jgi:hypothetical protein
MKSAPSVVKRFEWLTLLVIGISVVHTCLRFDSINASWVRYYGENKGTWITIVWQIIWALIILTFAYLITRRKSVAAKWIYISLVGFGAIGLFAPKPYEFYGSWTDKIAYWLIAAIDFYRASLLFTQDFEKWLAKGKQVKERAFPLGIPRIVLVLSVLAAITSFISKRSLESLSPSIYKDMALMHLKQTEEFIETYKQEHGAYPKSLEGLGFHNFLNDPSYDRYERPRQFHQYQLQPGGQHYTLFDVGPDGVSGTADDIYPLPDADFGGYVKK